MNLEDFKLLSAEIRSQGYPAETASHYASLIGDTPIVDAHGMIIVLEHGKELAKLLPLAFFGQQ